MTETRLYIDGQWQSGATTVENRNPSHLGDVIGQFAQAGAGQLDEALAAARRAQPAWWAAGIQKRHDVLMAIGTELMARAEEIGRMIAREEGKPLAEGKGEVYRAGQFFTYSAAEAAQPGRPGRKRPAGHRDRRAARAGGRGGDHLALELPGRHAGLEDRPGAGLWQCRGLETGEPDPGQRHHAGRDHRPAGHSERRLQPCRRSGPRGRAAAGRKPAGRCDQLHRLGPGRARHRRRGHRQHDQAADGDGLEEPDAHHGGCRSGPGRRPCGQRGLRRHRAEMHRRLAVDRACDGPRRLRRAAGGGGPGAEGRPCAGPGHADRPGGQRRAVATEPRLYPHRPGGRRRTALRGRPAGAGHAGPLHGPAVLAGTRNDMRINREEMFAPITCVIRTGSYDEALAIANDSAFGLTAGIMTRSLARASHFRANMRAGCVMVNLPTAGTDYHVPFGGRGASSFGPREQGRYAAEFYTTVKTAYVAAGVPE